MLTLIEREEAACSGLYRLMFRLLDEYRKFGGSLRPDMVRYPGQLSLLLDQFDQVRADCRMLQHLKREEGEDARKTASDFDVAGGDALARRLGAVGTSASG